MEQLFYNIDIILPNFSFSKPIESLQTYILMPSLLHQSASRRLSNLQEENATLASTFAMKKKIDIVQNYTSLGTCISSTGTFTLSLDHLRQKALHALFSLRRNSLKPSLACKIFDSMISPIVTYYSQVWGTFVKSDFKSWDNSPIEKTHLQFCKRYLKVHNIASNMASRAELGKYPMIIDINKKILNYLNYLQDKDDNSIVKHSLQISITT